MRFTLDLPANSDEKAAAIEKTRKLTNDWVARYRRDKGITGRPSYGNVYSALNAVSGHYNNFGTKYPLPQRKDRVLQEFETAEIRPFPRPLSKDRNLVGGCRVARCSYR